MWPPPKPRPLSGSVHSSSRPDLSPILKSAPAHSFRPQAMPFSAYGPATSMLPQWYLNPLRTGSGPGLCCPPCCGQGCSLPRPMLKAEVSPWKFWVPQARWASSVSLQLDLHPEGQFSSTLSPHMQPPLTLPFQPAALQGFLTGSPTGPLLLQRCCPVAMLCLTSTPWTAACQASLSFTVSCSLLRFTSIGLVLLSEDLVDCKLHNNK